MLRLNPRDEPDPLGDAFAGVRFRSAIFCRSELAAPWGFRVEGRELASFHFVSEGSALLEVDGTRQRIELGVGDLVVLPHGHGHVLRDTAGSPVVALDDLVDAHPLDEHLVLRKSGRGPRTTLLCGGFVFESAAAVPFLGALPTVLHVPAGRSGWIRVANELLLDELSAGRVGTNAILGRVCDLVFIEAVRGYFTDAAGGPRGWLAALADPHIGRAIAMIHREPERAWTVASLADIVGMSRSAFALRFSVLLGEAPIRYLTRHRMDRATSLLQSSRLTVARIAERVGYESEFAFSRAFKRAVGLSPAEYRRALKDRSA